MRQLLPDHARESRQTLIDILRREGPLDSISAAALVLGTETVPDSIAESVLALVVDGDTRFGRDSDGLLFYHGEDAQSEILSRDYVVLDVETTGSKPPGDRITELGAVRISGGEVVDEFVTLINPECEIPLDVVRVTGITDDMVEYEPTALDVIPRFAGWLGNSMVIAHNAWFDRSFMDAAWIEIFGDPTPNTWICSLRFARSLYPDFKRHRLTALCDVFGIDPGTHHRAGSDARATAYVFLRAVDDLAARGITTMAGLLSHTAPIPYRPDKSRNGIRHLVSGGKSG